MSDLIEREAVLNLIQNNWYGSNAFYMNHIREMPIIDAAPVIRCKDCKYYFYREYGHRCVNDNYVETGEEFCSWAERRCEEKVKD